jgi:hypothetical protein
MSEYVLSEVFKNKYAFYESILRGLADANKNQGINSVSRIESDFIVQIDNFEKVSLYKDLPCSRYRVDDDGYALKSQYFKSTSAGTINALKGIGDIPLLVFPFVLGGIVVEKQVRTFAQEVTIPTNKGAPTFGEVHELCVDDIVLAKKKEQIIDNALRAHVLELFAEGSDKFAGSSDKITGITQAPAESIHEECENIEEQIYYQSDVSLPDLIPAIPMGQPAQLPLMQKETKPTVKEALEALPGLIASASDLGVVTLNINETPVKFAYGFIRMPGSGTVNWQDPNDATGKVYAICEAPYVPVKRGGQKVQVSINGTTYDMNADLHATCKCKKVRAFIEEFDMPGGKPWKIEKYEWLEGQTTNKIYYIDSHPEYETIVLKQIVVLKTHVFVVDDFQNHMYCVPGPGLYEVPRQPEKVCVPIGWMQDEA